MWTFIKKLLGLEKTKKGILRDFFTDTADMLDKQYQHRSVQNIEIDKIVGSVGRADELDEDFRHPGRRNTGRYQRLDAALMDGTPVEPIKVMKVKRDKRDTQYYVVDGHHRVAVAKSHHSKDINAEVTEVVEPKKDDEE